MAIKNRDIFGRMNDEHGCTQFFVNVVPADFSARTDPIDCMFLRNDVEGRCWTVYMQYLNCPTPQLYRAAFEVPKSRMSLTYIAAVGMNLIRMLIAREIEGKQDVQFTIGDMVRDVVG